MIPGMASLSVPLSHSVQPTRPFRSYSLSVWDTSPTYPPSVSPSPADVTEVVGGIRTLPGLSNCNVLVTIPQVVFPDGTHLHLCSFFGCPVPMNTFFLQAVAGVVTITTAMTIPIFALKSMSSPSSVTLNLTPPRRRGSNCWYGELVLSLFLHHHHHCCHLC